MSFFSIYAAEHASELTKTVNLLGLLWKSAAESCCTTVITVNFNQLIRIASIYYQSDKHFYNPAIIWF